MNRDEAPQPAQPDVQHSKDGGQGNSGEGADTALKALIQKRKQQGDDGQTTAPPPPASS